MVSSCRERGLDPCWGWPILVVLTTSTLNRLMVVELALPAVLPGLLVALHYGIQITRPNWGFLSDQGGRRTRFIIGGMVALGLGALLAAGAIPFFEQSFSLGLALSVLAYALIGLGVGASGTSLLALLATATHPRRRAAAAMLTILAASLSTWRIMVPTNSWTLLRSVPSWRRHSMAPTKPARAITAVDMRWSRWFSSDGVSLISSSIRSIALRYRANHSSLVMAALSEGVVMVSIQKLVHDHRSNGNTISILARIHESCETKHTKHFSIETRCHPKLPLQLLSSTNNTTSIPNHACMQFRSPPDKLSLQVYY